MLFKSSCEDDGEEDQDGCFSHKGQSDHLTVLHQVICSIHNRGKKKNDCCSNEIELYFVFD